MHLICCVFLVLCQSNALPEQRALIPPPLPISLIRVAFLRILNLLLMHVVEQNFLCLLFLFQLFLFYDVCPQVT